MKKNGFTLVELLGVIVVLAILAGVTAISYNALLESQKQEVYKNYEQTLKTNARHYLIDNIDLIPTVGGSYKLTMQTLINEHIMESVKDQKGGKCDSSYVLITRNNNISSNQDDISQNYDLEYKVCLICDNYKTEGC